MTKSDQEPTLVTPLQFAFLTVLSGRAMTGEQMRTELALCGVDRTGAAFFRVMQRLKQAHLVSADRIPRDEGEYPGAQCRYELTQDGLGAIGMVRSMCRKVERRAWRLRWGRRHMGRQFKLSHRLTQSADRAGASRSERW